MQSDKSESFTPVNLLDRIVSPREEMAERIFVDWVERIDEYADEDSIRAMAEKSILAANIFFDVLDESSKEAV